ncbi:MAG: hypothetical protein HY226_02210 [Candidatus Vogelbacteria bacterium]|nr:hypothetical protein [Candidatus Vogelbacteria bacterium]
MSQNNTVAKVNYKRGFCGSFEARKKVTYIGTIVHETPAKKGKTVDKMQARIDFVDAAPIKPSLTKYFERRNGGQWMDQKGDLFMTVGEAATWIVITNDTEPKKE